MSDDERAVMREAALIAAASDPSPPCWWWLSFANDEQFLGVAILSAPNLSMAVVEAHRLGINPGGEVVGVELPDENVPDAQYRERLLSRVELREAQLTDE